MKNYRPILQSVLSAIKPSEQELQHINSLTDLFSAHLVQELRKARLKADVFVGGSLAKNTLIRKDRYDIDIFVRFDMKYEDDALSNLLEKVVQAAVKKFSQQAGYTHTLQRKHGSRDYFNIFLGKGKQQILFEVVPSTLVKNQKNARNVTDLSYFHVSFITRQVRKNPALADEIRLGKAFCYAQNCYGAETHVKGFSGYALEVLISHYGGFLALLKAAQAWNLKEKIIIDPQRAYKNAQEILVNINEAKLQSPIVVIDPTYELRNVTASVSEETLLRFVKTAKAFLTSPNAVFFTPRALNEQELRREAARKKAKCSVITVSSYLEGDIAAAKLVKFTDFLQYMLQRKGFIVSKREYEFTKRSLDEIKIVLLYKEPAKKMMVKGPPQKLEKHALQFRKKYKKTVVVKAGRLYAIVKRKNTLPDVLKEIGKGQEKEDMGVASMKIKK